MKVLTVPQPWATLIMVGARDVESRSENIVGSYRGPLLIHSASQPDDDYFMRTNWGKVVADRLGRPVEPLAFPLGAVLGRVTVVGVHHDDDDIQAEEDFGDVGDLLGVTRRSVDNYGHSRRLPLNYCPWGQPTFWHIELADPCPLAEPVQSPGRTGLWDWEPERPLVFQPTVSPPQASPTIHELYHAAQAHRKDHFWDDGSANRAGRARDTLVAILRGPDQVPSPGSLQETADPDLAPRPGRPTDPFQYPWWHNDLGPGSGSGLDL